MKISFSPPDITEREIAEVVDTLRSGWITTGPKTKRFEREIAEYCNVEQAVCLNSATAGLELILRILGIGAGDEVITSAYTYTASASVIDHVGAKIVLCDVAENSFEMDYDALEEKITPNTKAIIAVDIAGKPCDYEKLYKIAECKRAIFVPKNEIQGKIGRITIIADAAHSFGGARGGLKSGKLADFTSFSFHAVKNLTTAEGGAAVWNPKLGLDSEKLYREFMLWSLHGQSKDALAKTNLGAWEYDIERLGQKCNMTDIMAAIGLIQLKRYDALLARRKEIIDFYDSRLCAAVSLKHFENDIKSSGHLYLTRVDGFSEEERNRVIVEMAKRGVATNVHYKPLPMHTAYRNLGFHIKDFPNAYNMYRNEITLPLHTLLTDEEVRYVIDVFVECVRLVKADHNMKGENN